jgi:hypothetical protein
MPKTEMHYYYSFDYDWERLSYLRAVYERLDNPTGFGDLCGFFAGFGA